MQLSILYKKATGGALLQWRVWTDGADIHVEYGQVGGALQHTRTVAVGKNVGRANETTPEQQAAREARSQWEEKRTRDGYVENIDRARAGETDHAGGIDLMLAHPYKDKRKHMKYPAFEQPKLDGDRCYAEVRADGHVTLWSRNRKPILTMPHIIEMLSRLQLPSALPLDGELYIHGMTFQQITSIVKRMDHPESARMEFHVFDAVLDAPFSERYEILKDVSKKFGSGIRLVDTRYVETEKQAHEVFAEYLADKYEGAMLRAAAGKYEQKRSNNLLKLKEFEDHEYRIIDAVEGKGKLAGHVGAFSCETSKGVSFEVKLSGETAFLRKLFLESNLWKGNYMKTRHQGFTDGGAPRFPVGFGIVPPEDTEASADANKGAKR